MQLTAKDFKSDQEVRWCPGCGDYAILNVIQGFMPELGISRERIVFVSGIGCAARFPYYMQTYGMHSIHGRAPAIATGLAVTRPDLSVWVVTGDGDALSIGGNHLIHALRRNVNLKILLFNNRIYGLTKGQYSPTSELGKVTKSTPMGSLDYPFNPLSIAIGAEASFVARAIDTDKKGLDGGARGRRAPSRVGVRRDPPELQHLQRRRVRLRPRREGEPDLPRGRRSRSGSAPRARRASSSTRTARPRSSTSRRSGRSGLLVHDAAHREPSLAFALSRITFETDGAIPLGVFRRVERAVYDDLMSEQLKEARERSGEGDLAALLHSSDTWVVADYALPQEADDPLGDLLAFLLLQEVARARDDLGRAGARDPRRHPLGGGRREDRIGVGEEDERRPLPAARAQRAPRASLRLTGGRAPSGTSSGNASDPGLRLGGGEGRVVGVCDLVRELRHAREANELSGDDLVPHAPHELAEPEPLGRRRSAGADSRVQHTRRATRSGCSTARRSPIGPPQSWTTTVASRRSRSSARRSIER